MTDLAPLDPQRYENMGWLASDPWIKYDNQQAAAQTAYDDWMKLKKWTLDNGSARDRYLLRVQQQWRMRRRRWQRWWENKVTRKLHPGDFEDWPQIRTAMPNKVTMEALTARRHCTGLSLTHAGVLVGCRVRIRPSDR